MSQSNEDYIKEHKLKQLMEFLLEQLVIKRPKNPEKYLINVLERRQHLLVNRPKSSPSKSPSKRPNQSLGSPRSRTYEKPWLTNSGSFSPTPLAAHSTRPKTPKQLDMTGVGVVATQQRKENGVEQLKMADVVVDAKTVDAVKSRIINNVRTYGKVPKRLPIQNEELKLADYPIEAKETKKVTVETRKKGEKSSTKEKAAKHVNQTGQQQQKQSKQQISGLFFQLFLSEPNNIFSGH